MADWPTDKMAELLRSAADGDVLESTRSRSLSGVATIRFLRRLSWRATSLQLISGWSSIWSVSDEQPVLQRTYVSSREGSTPASTVRIAATDSATS